MRLRSLFIVFILSVFYLNCFSQQPNSSKNDSSIIVKNDTMSKFSFGGSNFTVSKYIPRSGTQVGKGSANQTLAYVSYSNFTAYVWFNYGFPDSRITEIDYGLEYKYRLSQKFLKGNWDIKAGAHKYIFPVPELNNFILEGTLSYRGIVESDVLYTYCFESTKIESGSRIYIELRKPFEIKIKKLKSELIPQLSTAYHWGFYGWQKFGQITPGLRYKMHFSKFSINTFLNYQFSADDISEGYITKKRFLYGGIGIEF